MAYDYLSGTLAGGLFDSLNQVQNLNQAQFTQNPQYVPGSGTAPYAMDTGGTSSTVPSFSDGNYTGGSGSTFSTYDPSDLWVGGKLYTGATAAHMRSQGAQDDSFLEIGKMSPEQIARNAAIMGGSSGGMSDAATSGGMSDAATSGGGAIDRTPSAGAITSGQPGGVRGDVTSTQPNLAGLLQGLGSGGGGTQLPPGTIGLSGSPNINYQSPQNTQLQQPQGGALQMQQNPQQALQGYYNNPGYQLAFGQDINQRFQADPGYQYAVDQAMNQVGQNASARGLLGSGRMVRDMTDRAQQMANQQYDAWWNRQQNVFNNYQNRLQGLAGGPTGADYANQLGTNLGQAGLTTGSNIGSVLGGMGTAGMSGIMNTGAAAAGNINNAGSQAAQIQAANQATRLAGATLGQQGGLF